MKRLKKIKRLKEIKNVMEGNSSVVLKIWLCTYLRSSDYCTY